jgi:hypothetical protein
MNMDIYVVRCEDPEDNHTIGVYDDLDKAVKEIRKNAHSDTKFLGKSEKEIKTIRKVFDKWEKSLKNGLSGFTESPCVAEDSDIYYSIEKFEIK